MLVESSMAVCMCLEGAPLLEQVTVTSTEDDILDVDLCSANATAGSSPLDELD